MVSTLGSCRVRVTKNVLFKFAKPVNRIRWHVMGGVHRQVFKNREFGKSIDPSIIKSAFWLTHTGSGSMASHLCQFLWGYIHNRYWSGLALNWVNKRWSRIPRIQDGEPIVGLAVNYSSDPRSWAPSSPIFNFVRWINGGTFSDFTSWTSNRVKSKHDRGDLGGFFYSIEYATANDFFPDRYPSQRYS